MLNRFTHSVRITCALQGGKLINITEWSMKRAIIESILLENKKKTHLNLETILFPWLNNFGLYTAPKSII